MSHNHWANTWSCSSNPLDTELGGIILSFCKPCLSTLTCVSQALAGKNAANIDAHNVAYKGVLVHGCMKSDLGST